MLFCVGLIALDCAPKVSHYDPLFYPDGLLTSHWLQLVVSLCDRQRSCGHCIPLNNRQSLLTTQRESTSWIALSVSVSSNGNQLEIDQRRLPAITNSLSSDTLAFKPQMKLYLCVAAGWQLLLLLLLARYCCSGGFFILLSICSYSRSSGIAWIQFNLVPQFDWRPSIVIRLHQIGWLCIR